MTYDDLRRLLEPERDALRAQGVTALYVFGSVARGDAQEASDVDLMIDVDPNSRFNIFDLSGINIRLSEHLGTRIDVITRDSVHRRVKDRVSRKPFKSFDGRSARTLGAL